MKKSSESRAASLIASIEDWWKGFPSVAPKDAAEYLAFLQEYVREGDWDLALETLSEYLVDGQWPITQAQHQELINLLGSRGEEYTSKARLADLKVVQE